MRLEVPPTRAVLLGTIDPDSVLCRLPKSDGVLNIILSFVVLYYQGDVSVHRVWRALKRANTRAGQPDCSVEGSENWQPDAVADDARVLLCARPHERRGGSSSAVPCSVVRLLLIECIERPLDRQTGLLDGARA